MSAVARPATQQQSTPITVSSDQAQQEAKRELQQSKYQKPLPEGRPSGTSTTAAGTMPNPQLPPAAATASNVGLIVAVVLGIALLVLAAVFLLRRFARSEDADRTKAAPKRRGGTKRGAAVPVGAAKHRKAAHEAAAGGDFTEAIRELFRAIIATLDESGVMPERPERTADEAATDAGRLMPKHVAVLASAARSFDEVQYGEYVGTAENYALICRVDEAVQTFTPQAPVRLADLEPAATGGSGRPDGSTDPGAQRKETT